MPKKKIDSWEQLQQQVASILAHVNKDQRLALAAAVNPLFALEELGYEISPGVRPEIEDRLRFGAKKATRLKELRASIFKQAGRQFDIDSPTELGRVLFDELKLRGANVNTRADAYEGGSTIQQSPAGSRLSASPDTKPLPYRRPEAEPLADPLEVLKEAHPVIAPLLEYRRLEASRPRFAPRSFFEAVRQGKRSLPVRELRGRLKARAGRK